MAPLRTPKAIFDAYDNRILTRSELFSRLLEVLTMENAEEVRSGLGRLCPALETWIDSFENGMDVTVGGYIIPHTAMKRACAAWRASDRKSGRPPPKRH